MPRPKVLRDAYVIPIVIEREQYIALKEISSQTRKSISKIIRELIDDYLKRYGFKEAEIMAFEGKLITLGKIEQKVLSLELRDHLTNLEKSIELLKKTRKGTLDYYQRKENTLKIIKQTLSVMNRLGVPSDETLEKMYRLIKEYEEITNEKVKEKPWV